MEALDAGHPVISIHAPRVGSDCSGAGCCRPQSHFNPRSPCGERLLPAVEESAVPEFQSTLPVWGATRILRVRWNRVRYFNPRSPCGERPLRQCHGPGEVTQISIHAPRVGSDIPPRPWSTATPYFNPRSPCGERPHGSVKCISPIGISIHAPRVGSDSKRPKMPTQPPIFQSTLPVWGATPMCLGPRQRRDYFNPRSPCVERPDGGDPEPACGRISIHAPRVGSDC